MTPPVTRWGFWPVGDVKEDLPLSMGKSCIVVGSLAGKAGNVL